jgi:hypothetical protein
MSALSARPSDLSRNWSACIRSLADRLLAADHLRSLFRPWSRHGGMGAVRGMVTKKVGCSATSGR